RYRWHQMSILENYKGIGGSGSSFASGAGGIDGIKWRLHKQHMRFVWSGSFIDDDDLLDEMTMPAGMVDQIKVTSGWKNGLSDCE
ncbi:hypothetical protein MKW92_005065, partial [Papaver armeniacum]